MRTTFQFQAATSLPPTSCQALTDTFTYLLYNYM
jgi:hypothetical protein